MPFFKVICNYNLQHKCYITNDTVFCAVGGLLGGRLGSLSNIFQLSMKTLPYLFSLHLFVYLCYKLIYGRAIVCRKSFMLYIRKCTFLSEYPTHLLGIYKLKTRLEKTCKQVYLSVLTMYQSQKLFQSNLHILADSSGKGLTHCLSFSTNLDKIWTFFRPVTKKFDVQLS